MELINHYIDFYKSEFVTLILLEIAFQIIRIKITSYILNAVVLINCLFSYYSHHVTCGCSLGGRVNRVRVIVILFYALYHTFLMFYLPIHAKK